jgi:uncharacterized coiled-coil protein SlyX
MASSTTDWIQAIGVLLGVPITAYGIIKLFIKDKENQRKLASLEMMSKHQENIVRELHLQVVELIKQGSELKYQSFLMSEANKLMEKQIELQYNIHSENKKSTEDAREFERSKRLSEVKPYFAVEPDSSSPDEFKFRIVNKGSVARNVELETVILEQCYINKIAKRDTVEKNTEIVFVGRPRDSKHSRDVEFEVHLLFQDIDDNQYFQTIKKERNHKYTISEPVIKI